MLGSLGLIHVPDRGGPLALLREPAFLQIVLNVLLFVPLGYFVRVILHRGVVVATVAGFGLSLLIEFTQKTGVWHLYSCAYRLFDVDDLIVNTLGATVGSLLSILVVRRRRADVVLPTTISFGRRLVGFASDVLFIALTGAAAALAWRAWRSTSATTPARPRPAHPEPAAVGRPVRGRGGAGARLRADRRRIGRLAAHRAAAAAAPRSPAGWSSSRRGGAAVRAGAGLDQVVARAYRWWRRSPW